MILYNEKYNKFQTIKMNNRIEEKEKHKHLNRNLERETCIIMYEQLL
jgi:hypothetical protein